MFLGVANIEKRFFQIYRLKFKIASIFLDFQIFEVMILLLIVRRNIFFLVKSLRYIENDVMKKKKEGTVSLSRILLNSGY